MSHLNRAKKVYFFLPLNRVLPTRLVITWDTGGENHPKQWKSIGNLLNPEVSHPSDFPSSGRTLLKAQPSSGISLQIPDAPSGNASFSRKLPSIGNRK